MSVSYRKSIQHYIKTSLASDICVFNVYMGISMRQLCTNTKLLYLYAQYREQIMFILSRQIKYSKQKLHLIYVIIKKMFLVYFGYLFRC